ncbi:MAG TPA: sigma-70 family RNA polymerase sigma factor [Desulfomonilaceae bacterium]|nr:sigma-70 family RNA polymerase sigma factor [Desulfomonilaceae bacterium]
MNDAPFSKFRSFYDSLVRSATSRGILFADAQDLAGDAVERALASFDPAKGEFPAFCHTILSNLMKNYWRDRKRTEEYADVDGPADPEPFIDALELAESVREIRAAVSEIKKNLSPQENTFLKHLQDVLDQSGPRAISEAARRTGLTPAKGWDLFRKIQRKAKGISARLESDLFVSEVRIERPVPMMPAQQQPDFSFASRDILARFTPEQLKLVESYLP